VGFSGLAWFFKLFTFDLTGEYYVQTIAVFALIGLIILIFKKQYLLPTLFIVIFIAAPRSATRSLAPVIALFASYSLMMLLNYLNSKVQPAIPAAGADDLLKSKLSKLVLGILIIQWVISTFTLGSTLLKDRTITAADQAAFTWASENTPSGSRFLVLTGSNPLLDPVSEWFITLSGRQSIATLYGYEWKADADFQELHEKYSAVQACFNQSVDCITDWLQESGSTMDYLLVRNPAEADSSGVMQYHSALQDSLRQNDRFSVVYDTPEVSIFAFEGSR
jgi:hypothetical protein